MLNYVNGFSIATDKEKKHLLIRFVQDLPNFDDDNTVSRENVTNIIMDRQIALELIKIAKGILEEED